MKQTKGFTLIELTIYGGLLGILLTILSEFFITIVNLQLKIETTTAIDQDSEYINARIAYDVHRASAITAPAIGITDDGFSLIAEGQQVEYALSTNSLILTTEGVAASLNSDRTRVINFSATRIGNSGTIAGANDTLDISYTLETVGQTQSGTSRRTYETAVSLR